MRDFAPRPASLLSKCPELSPESRRKLCASPFRPEASGLWSGTVHLVPFLRCTAHPYRCTVKLYKNIMRLSPASTPEFHRRAVGISQSVDFANGAGFPLAWFPIPPAVIVVTWDLSAPPRKPEHAAVPSSATSGRAALRAPAQLRCAAANRPIRSRGAHAEAR